MKDRWEMKDDRLERHLEYELKRRNLTRRDLVRGGTGMASAVGLASFLAACGDDDDDDSQGASGGQPEKYTGTLKVIGLGVDLIDPIKEAGEKALGFQLEFEVTDTVTMTQRALTQPQSFDVFSGYVENFDQIWSSGNFIAVDRAKIPRWDEVTDLVKYGRVNPNDKKCTTGQGDAPFRKVYVNAVEEPGDGPTAWANEDSETEGEEPPGLIGVPMNFNMDSLGYNSDVIQKEPGDLSWSELFNPQWRGRTAVLADPRIALEDTANAAEALDLLSFQDKGNMSEEEIDGMFKILDELKKKKHFRAFWTTFDESVNLMQSGEVVIESMWSPAVALLQSSGEPVRYAAPKEGFRGWFGHLGFPSHLTEDESKLQAAYDYANWWHSGAPGAIMMRQGYYNAVQGTSRRFVEPFEWDYWIAGRPATKAIPNPFGEETAGIKRGTVRDGGAFEERACRYATWNSFFNDNDQMVVDRWNEFLAG
jgi:putative spermidine/putrescine transport system substrate-binding protein